MANLGNPFDPNEERGEFEPMPPGEYQLQVVESEVREKGDHTGINLTFEVTHGVFKGRRAFDYLNIRHSNPDAQSISRRRLAEYCRAVRAGTISDSEELHFRPFLAKLTKEKRTDNGEFTNKVKSPRPLPPPDAPSGGVGTPSNGGPPDKQGQASSGARPWVR